MKAIFKYSLYRRSKPSHLEKAFGYMLSGSTIEVAEVCKGETLDGIGLWMKANDGFYYWAGGLEMNESATTIAWSSLTPETKTAVVASIINDRSDFIKQQVTDYRGCAVGYKNDDPTNVIGLTIFVGAKTNDVTIGKNIVWKSITVPVDFKETGAIKELFGEEYAAAESSDPMLVGGRIFAANGKEFGTRSLVLRKRNGNSLTNERFLLTCFHVILNPLKSNVGKAFKANDPQLNGYGAIYPKTNKKLNPETLSVELASYDAFSDFCVAKLTDDYSLKNMVPATANPNFSDFNSWLLFNDLEKLMHQELTMAGTKSGVRSATVTDVQGKVQFTSSNVEFRGLIVTKAMSQKGDSGAPVVDSQNRLVGIVIGGDENDHTYILPVYSFLFNNNFSLDI